MDLNTYQTLAMMTDSQYQNSKERLLNGVMGLNGEAGETIDIVKKHLFQGHELNKTEIVEELGDILWYIALTADTLGVSLTTVAEFNINKLRKRYPDGFSAKDSIYRDDPVYKLKEAVMEELKS